MKTLKAPIKYFGGKGTMWNEIRSKFPEKGTYSTYIEPFGGSFAIGLKADEYPPVEIYNDLEKNVYSLYKVLNDDEMFREFQSMCEKTYYSEDLRKEYANELKDENKEMTTVERAFKFFYVNRLSRNGVGGLSTTLSVRRGMSKSTSDFLSTVENLPQLHDRLSRVIVLNRDAIGVIKKYDSPDVFIYCDPPYDWSTRSNVRYNVDMAPDKQDEFLDAVINSKSKILISGYDCERYKILEENGFRKVQFTVTCMAGSGNSTKDKVETLWMNY